MIPRSTHRRARFRALLAFPGLCLLLTALPAGALPNIPPFEPEPESIVLLSETPEAMPTAEPLDPSFLAGAGFTAIASATPTAEPTAEATPVPPTGCPSLEMSHRPSSPGLNLRDWIVTRSASLDVKLQVDGGRLPTNGEAVIQVDLPEGVSFRSGAALDGTTGWTIWNDGQSVLIRTNAGPLPDGFLAQFRIGVVIAERTTPTVAVQAQLFVIPAGGSSLVSILSESHSVDVVQFYEVINYGIFHLKKNSGGAWIEASLDDERFVANDDFGSLYYNDDYVIEISKSGAITGAGNWMTADLAHANYSVDTGEWSWRSRARLFIDASYDVFGQIALRNPELAAYNIEENGEIVTVHRARCDVPTIGYGARLRLRDFGTHETTGEYTAFQNPGGGNNFEGTFAVNFSSLEVILDTVNAFTFRLAQTEPEPNLFAIPFNNFYLTLHAAEVEPPVMYLVPLSLRPGL